MSLQNSAKSFFKFKLSRWCIVRVERGCDIAPSICFPCSEQPKAYLTSPGYDGLHYALWYRCTRRYSAFDKARSLQVLVISILVRVTVSPSPLPGSKLQVVKLEIAQTVCSGNSLINNHYAVRVRTSVTKNHHFLQE